jgi:hypothetical protein
MIVALGILAYQAPNMLDVKGLKKYEEYYPELVECLDHELEARGLSYGVGNYWDAKYVTMLSKKNIKIIQVTEDLKPYHWISNVEWYQRYLPQFILLYNSQTLLDPQASRHYITERFGLPAEEFQCQGRDVMVYSRKSDWNFHTYLSYPLYLNFDRPGAKAMFYAATLPSQVGEVMGLSRVAVDGKVGYITYGPYIELGPGTYEAVIFYQGEGENAAEIVWKWDVIISKPASFDVVKEGFLSADNKSINVNFEIYKKSIIEVRTFYNGKGCLSVHAIRLRRVG